MVRAAVDTTREAARSMRGCATIEIVGNSKIMGTANEIEMANQSWQRAAVADRKLSFYGDSFGLNRINFDCSVVFMTL